MVSRRDWLVSKGLAKPGRGRLSREAHAAIEKAIAGGMVFDDVRVSTQTSTSENGEATKIVRKVAKPEEFFGDTPAKVYDGGWFVIEDGERKELNGAEVCRTCMLSLDWHRCATPTFPAFNGDFIPVSRVMG